MELVVNSIDLLRATKNYPFDMGSITEEQWMQFGEDFIMNKEQKYPEEFSYMLENAQMKVKFSEPKVSYINSMVANVKIQYLHQDGKLSTLDYKFCEYGQVDNPFSEASDIWRSVILKANENNNNI